MSPDGRYFVDSCSSRTQPNVTVVRDCRRQAGHGRGPAGYFETPRHRLDAPTPFTVKARDGFTDIYGYMFKPTHLDPSQKYPIVDFIYPGPQGKSCPNPGLSRCLS